MLEGAREIKIHGQWISVAAEVTDLPMLSAHADANELMRWLSGFQRPPRRVFIVHGEAQASEALRPRIDHELVWDAVVPRRSQVFELCRRLSSSRHCAHGRSACTARLRPS